MPTKLRTAGQTFFDNPRLLRRIALFEKEVKEDPRRFEAGTLRAFELEVISYGTQQLTNLSQALIERDLAQQTTPGIFLALRTRHIGLWERAVSNAFATAASSIEGRTRFPGQRTILQRLLNALLKRKEEHPEEDIKIPKNVQELKELQGIVRTRKVQGKTRIFRQSLSATIKMLFRTMPRNLHRDHNLLVSKLTLGPLTPGDMEVFQINSGQSATSCTTCRVLNGQFMTRDAVKFAATRLQPTLFHPNCRHFTLKRVATVKTFKEQKKLVTLEVMRKLVASGQLKLAKRPVNSPVSI